ncbi:hypothetical protein C5B42_00990 [Candidatus Cerribacteria bacterium 'Amazon FNV 2010 28 9']|uniref:Polyprenyl synthetase family protein n=1 Tax=Candidatus Cerribacteria bacterium 'Amazon FNV 2010 28 9' TaxID=2081795 RepID=A0A317JSI8_9BACT|nr:MAG: hypothetical protein C5B42_00990 [Candidatus Cerribacteria bacterium 'Amazon FNV 2010 28 9']
MTLPDSLDQMQIELSSFLRSFFKQEKKQAEKVDPTLVESVEMLERFCLRGGKAISPFLTKIAYTLSGGKDLKNLLPVLAAIELHHKHLLIIDDIADRDELRYNGPTLEYAYRTYVERYPSPFPDPGDVERDHRARSLAMLDGVYLSGLSKKLLFQSGFDSKLLIKCLTILQDIMYAQTLAGWKIQFYQNMMENKQATEKQFMKGLELVTSRYKFTGPFRIGRLLSGNEDVTLSQALETYAVEIGKAFQIHDDILGLFGDPLVTGKPAGNDVREGKKTLLIQKTYHHVDYGAKSFLDICVGNQTIGSKDIQRIQRMVKDSGALRYCEVLEQECMEKGIQAIHDLPDSDEKQLLFELAHFVVERKK